MMLDAADVTAFYDGYTEKLVADYVAGNARIDAAIKHALRYMPSSARRILDVGCGIGWSTREFGRHVSDARVAGLDLSPKLIDLARQLTLEPNVEYRVQDVLDEKWQPSEVFDVIVMLDVYEHIPVARRRQLHGLLARLLGAHGVLILSCPTPEHQMYLRRHHQDGLQPVDEDVDEAVLNAAAQDLGARLTMCERVRIWAPNDYVHAVIARPGADLPRRGGPEPSLLPVADRARLVEQQLRLAVVGKRVVVPIDRGGPLACIATPELDLVSETFIRNHIKRLPMSVCVVHGRPIARDEHNRVLTARPRLLTRAARKVWRILGRGAADSESDRIRSVGRYFRERGVAVVLAEYGVTGVELLDACRIVGVPLVVHFHGYDAYQESIVSGPIGRRYRDLFEYARGIVVVSRHMRDQLLKLGAPAEKLHVIPCGVDTYLFESADPGAAPPNLLAVGRFVEKKAPHLLIVAMSRVILACPEARLTMIGSGPLLPACRQLAAALGVAHAVDFLGAQGHEVVARHMRRARAFVQHSITASDGDSEGTPTSILEAQVTGLPVIATRHTGILDSVSEGQTGFLVDEQDVEGMADQMVRVVRNPDEATALGKAARAAALERFSLEQSLTRLSEVLRHAAL